MFPFRFITPNYVVYKSCGSYSPLRQDLEQSPPLSLSLWSDSCFLSLLPISISVARFCSVCLRSVWPQLGVLPPSVFLRSVCLLSLVSPLSVFSCCSSCHSHSDCPIIANLPIRQPQFRSKGPQFQSRSLRSLSSTLNPSSPGLWDSSLSSGIGICPTTR